MPAIVITRDNRRRLVRIAFLTSPFQPLTEGPPTLVKVHSHEDEMITKPKSPLRHASTKTAAGDWRRDSRFFEIESQLTIRLRTYADDFPWYTVVTQICYQLLQLLWEHQNMFSHLACADFPTESPNQQ